MTARHVSLAIPVGGGPVLEGALSVPDRSVGVVLFAHGSGSSRMSPRNVQVAERLNAAGLATVLFDLLSDEEARDRANVFDVPLLAERLGAATDHVMGLAESGGLAVGYFGASTGAAGPTWPASVCRAWPRPPC